MTLFRIIGKYDPDTIWIIIVFLLMAGLGYLYNKLSNGYCLKYQKLEINKYLKNLLTTMHIFGSIIPSLVLPNNYLNASPYFEKLFLANQFWIPVTMIIIFSVTFILLGLISTYLAQRLFK